MKLKRVADTEIGTFGVLIDSGVPFAVTLENPWQNNLRFVSCIPEGTYRCKRVDSPNFGDTFKIMDVPDREDILFHWGNTDEDTLGCVLVGEEFGKLYGQGAILRSKNGFNEFMEKLSGVEEFTLVIQSI